MATRTSVGSGLWSVAGTWDSAPADDDLVVIAAGHEVIMDTDLSGWTGLRTVTVNGGATPGELIFTGVSKTVGVIAAGSGYAVGNILTLTSGGGCTVTVATVDVGG